MKKRIAAVILLAMLLLSSCQGGEKEDSGAFQEASDRAYAAKGYAETLFALHMEQAGISQYEIEQTSYGFRTSLEPRYFVEFAYQAEGKSRTYGYVVSVNDDYQCSLLEESGEIPVYDLLLEEE